MSTRLDDDLDESFQDTVNINSEGSFTPKDKNNSAYKARLSRARSSNSMKLGGLLGRSEATLLGDTESSDSPHFGSDSGRQEPERPSRASNADSTRTEVEDASPSTRPSKGVQRFQEGATVLCMRSTGAESPAMVLSYDPISETYEVELDAVGSGLRKRCKEDSLRKAQADLPGAAAPPDFAIGACVFVKRSSGDESMAFVQSYANGVYVLELESKGSGKKKNAPASMIRSSPSEAPPPPPPPPPPEASLI